MDTLSEGFYGGFKFDHGLIPLYSNQNYDSTSSPGTSSEGESLDFPYTTLKYISEILMDEDLEGTTSLLQDRRALQAAEKPFYDVLGQNYPVDYQSNQIQDRGSIGSLFVSDSHGEIESVAKFTKGVEEANKFLPNISSLAIDLENTPLVSNVGNGLRGKKNHHRENSGDPEEGRSSKQSAGYSDDFVEQKFVDEVLLCNPVGEESASCFLSEASQNGEEKKLQNNVQLKESKGRIARGKKQVKKKGVVDLSTLLTQCAQAVSSHDQRTATELLKQIRQHSSHLGDGSQRLAHYVADALEMRMGSKRPSPYTFNISVTTSAFDIFKSYHLFISACPFKIMSNYIANRTILKVAENATSLHIIDFGILYGFQWPCLIKKISERPGGAPKLRITGIEPPQPGFRPAESVEETGRRLEKYFKQFNVQFEYRSISQKWETIRYEDLKIDKDEMTVVNCLYRMKNLPDETLVANSPRDAVLKLIKQINPVLFMHGVVNGTYNAPFFLTRFREALFHFSALFDMFETIIPRENRERMLFEREVFARDVMNVVACEGWERAERPETYKQWQVRNLRAGFRQIPFNQEILKKVKQQVKSKYHKDFVVDEDGQWMLQGWKGRIIYCMSCWEPE